MNKEIFVFGSNRQGRHGKGAAWHAKENYGAMYGQAKGRQGDSYAIITKELRRDKPVVGLEEVKTGVHDFLDYAISHPELTFKLTAIGCGLASFTVKDIAPLFSIRPNNIILPSEFHCTVVNLYKDSYDIYIGRPGKNRSGEFGNPFIVGKHGQTGECVALFEEWFYSEDTSAIAMQERVRHNIPLSSRLGCFCKPLKKCHGDVIAGYINNNYDKG